MTIGKIAREAGVGVETVRFYERKGLIHRPASKSGSFRVYSPDVAARIRFVRRAQELGFTLKESKEILELHSNPRATCADIRRRAEAKIDEVRAKIKDLRKMQKSLAKLAEACGESRQALASCGVLDCFEEGWRC